MASKCAEFARRVWSDETSRPCAKRSLSLPLHIAVSKCCKDVANDVPPLHQRRCSRICTILDFLQSSNRRSERNQKHSLGRWFLSIGPVFRTHHTGNFRQRWKSRAVDSRGSSQFAAHIAGRAMFQCVMLFALAFLRDLLTCMLQSRLIGLIQVAGLVLALTMSSTHPRTQVAGF